MRVFSVALLAFLSTSARTAETPLLVHSGGRVITNSGGSLSFGWPATYFESRFHGAAVSVSLETTGGRLRLMVDGAERLC